jgi:hypothetical protein
MSRRPSAIYLVCVVLVVLSALLVPSCRGGGGEQCTIEIRAKLDGIPCSGNVSYNLTPASGSPLSGDTVPKIFLVASGTWTCTCSLQGLVDHSSGTLTMITPSPTQSVSGGGTITFYLNFKTTAT